MTIATLLLNDRITYRLLRFLPNHDIVNLMTTSTDIHQRIVVNKVIYKNLIKTSNKELKILLT